MRNSLHHPATLQEIRVVDAILEATHQSQLERIRNRRRAPRLQLRKLWSIVGKVEGGRCINHDDVWLEAGYPILPQLDLSRRRQTGDGGVEHFVAADSVERVCELCRIFLSRRLRVSECLRRPHDRDAGALTWRGE